MVSSGDHGAYGGHAYRSDQEDGRKVRTGEIKYKILVYNKEK